MPLSAVLASGHPVPRHRGVRTALHRVALLGNHLPRQCGIATFTTDLATAIAEEYPHLDAIVVAMNDVGRHHAYPPAVRFEVTENDLTSYQRAADFLNVSTVDVVSLQHEYGIFGGRAGQMVLSLLADLRMPVVTTLHTILAAPDAAQRRVMDEIIRYSERLVVMSQHGAKLLEDVHGVPAASIDVIPHGIPEFMLAAGDKDRLGVAGKTVILTCGLLSPDKGIEDVIDALPAILAVHPDTVYLVLGATHPHVREQHGESYRLMLEARAQALGVDGSIIFHDRFVSREELGEFLLAADVYVTPYLNLEQSTSGTLAYAVGAGKAVISTGYRYATELLADGRGILVPRRDPAAIAAAVLALRGSLDQGSAMRQRAATYGRAMAWGTVAQSHVASLERAVQSHTQRRRTAFRARTLAERAPGLPEHNLDHLRTLTDDTGVMQHAQGVVPRYADGYCLDDNARALLLMARLAEAGSGDPRQVRALTTRYLAFVAHAFDAPSGRFRNFMDYARSWVPGVGSEDSHGRAIWALGAMASGASDPGCRGLAGELFHASLPVLEGFTSPRAWAYALLGVGGYLRAFEGDRAVHRLRGQLASRLLGLHAAVSTPEWPWFEDRLTYANARLPQALLVSGAAMGDGAMAAVARTSLAWLARLQRNEAGDFSPIGSDGFYVRGGAAARFDQQPIEACGMVSASLDAYRLDGNAEWLRTARVAMAWFLGRNPLHLPLHDPSSGGCRDGVHVDRLNANQGAESTISFLLALQDMKAAERAGPVSAPLLPRT